MAHKLHKIIEHNKVVVFSKEGCPFCEKAENLLNSFQVAVHEVQLLGGQAVEDAAELQHAIKSKYNHETFPSIFISGKFIGGNSELVELNQQNKLKALLA